MDDQKEFQIKMSADASSLVDESKRGADSLNKLGEANEQAGKAAEKHGAHLHALHKIFHQLNEVVPGLGVVMQAAFSPIGAAISLAVIALQTFREKMKELDEQFQKFEENAAKPLTNRLNAQRESVISLAKTHAELADRLAHTAHAEQTLKENTDKAIESFKRQAGQAQELNEALNQRDLEQLEEMHALGILSEQQFAAKKIEIQEAYHRKKREIEEREAMVAILAQKRALEEAKVAQPGLTSAATAAGDAAVRAHENLNALPSDEQLRDNQKTAAGALSDWQKKNSRKDVRFDQTRNDAFEAIGPGLSREAFQAAMFKNFSNGGSAYVSDADWEAYGEWEKLKAGVKGADEAFKRAPGDRARAEVAASQADRAAARAAGKSESNQDFIDERGRSIGEQRAQFDERHKANDDLDRIEREKAKARGDFNTLNDPLGRLVATAGSAEFALAHAQRIEPAQQQALQQFKNLATVLGLPAQELIDAMNHVGNSMQWTRQETEAIKKRMAELEGHDRSSRFNTGG